MKTNLSIIIMALSILLPAYAICQWNYNGDHIYNINSGYVGIGNSNPGSLLQVGKNMTEPSISVRNFGGSGGATFSMIDDASGADWKFKATLYGGFKIRDHAYGLDVIIIEPNSFANAFYIKNTGNIGIGTSSPDNSALMDLSSSSKGFLPPRMTQEELNTIAAPANGLIVLCSNCGTNEAGALAIYLDGNWMLLNTSCMNPMPPIQGTHVPSENQIIWNWNTVAGATGYKWNTTNDYTTAEDLGANTTKTETGLICNSSITRYVWAYSETCQSQVSTLSASTTECTGACAGVPSILYSGQTYNTVQIGTQCWLKESLNVGTQIDGLVDPTNNGIIEKYCFNNIESNCETYGGLYQWSEMMNYNSSPGSQGICPAGWHVPTDSEWCTMEVFLDATVDCIVIGWKGTDAGDKLKNNDGWDDGNNGSNYSGFSALPGGVRYTTYFNGEGFASDIWTSTSTAAPGGLYHVMRTSNDIGRFNSDFSDHHGFAVRCIKNQ